MDTIKIDWLSKIEGNRGFLICGPTADDRYIVIIDGKRERIPSERVLIQRHYRGPFTIFTRAMSDAAIAGAA